MDIEAWKKAVDELMDMILKAESMKQRLDLLSKMDYYISLARNDCLFRGGK